MMGLERLGRIPSVVNVPGLLRSPAVQAAASLAVGLLVATLAYILLHSLPAAETLPEASAPAAQGPVGRFVAEDSLSRLIAAGKVGVVVPVGALEPMTSSVVLGDRFEIIALVPNDRDTPQAAVVVHGATLRGRSTPASAGSMLLEVTPDEAIILGHLMQSGIRLSYALWPANGAPAEVPPVNIGTLRDRLGEQLVD